ncbi:MAG: outer membrane protein assembly factor BamD [Candidatus Cryptobacteroides sp.]
MKFRTLFLAAVTLVVLSSCKSEFEAMLNSSDVDAKYEAAFKYYNDRKYSKAASLFESLSVMTSGSERDDTVRYYWGLSNYKYKDYYTAETNFERFVETFPRSPFASEARYLRLDCLYRSTLRYELDQTPTYKAITAISEYMIEFPSSTHIAECKDMLEDLNERLDRKAYEGARLYYKMEDYLASRVALRNVLKDDSENMYREDILYYIAMSSYKYAQLSVHNKQRERYLVFVDDYFNFVGELPDSKYRKELDAVYQKVQKALGRNPVVTEDAGKSERDFAKERKLIQKEMQKRTENK